MQRSKPVEMPMKIGQLARRSGVTIRTLHWYDQCGVLRPSLRSASGHRLYTPGDVARLTRIRALQQLGLTLEQIAAALRGREGAPRRIVAQQLAALNAQVRAAQRLRRRLRRLEKLLEQRHDIDVEEFLLLLEDQHVYEKYYTPEQRAQLDQRARDLGPERIKAVEAEWPKLMAEVQAAMQRGDDPASAPVQALARRWMGLVREFTGGDAGITQSVKNLYQNESQVHGMDTAPMRELMIFIQKALAAAP